MSETAAVVARRPRRSLRLDGLTRRARRAPGRARGRRSTIPPGEVTALLGPNGAGKSSLVLAVGGVLQPDGRAVLLGERDLAARAGRSGSAQAGVAIVPEGRRLLPDAHRRGQPQRRHLRAVARGGAASGTAYALELFPELEKRLDVAARSLSGGEQQMVVLAQALVSQPTFMLIDELSLGLAPVVVAAARCRRSGRWRSRASACC